MIKAYGNRVIAKVIKEETPSAKVRISNSGSSGVLLLEVVSVGSIPGTKEDDSLQLSIKDKILVDQQGVQRLDKIDHDLYSVPLYTIIGVVV